MRVGRATIDETPESEVVRVIVAVTAGELSENDLAVWLRGHIEAIDHDAS